MHKHGPTRFTVGWDGHDRRGVGRKLGDGGVGGKGIFRDLQQRDSSSARDLILARDR